MKKMKTPDEISISRTSLEKQLSELDDAEQVKVYQGNLEKQGGVPGAGFMLVSYGEPASSVLWKSNLGACVRFV